MTTGSHKLIRNPKRNLASSCCCIAAFLCALASPGTLSAERPSPAAGKTREYFSHQEPYTTLVLRFQPFETEFESRIYDPANLLILDSGVPSLRLGPIFQLIEPVDKQRQLRIEVSMGRATSRSNLDMRIIRFDRGGPDSSVLIKAYRLLSFGLEIERSNSRERWTLKVVSLKQAASTFDYLGIEELQLWSEYYAYYFLWRVLGDPLTAAEGAREIYPAAVRSNLKELALAAVQLEAVATVSQTQSGGARAADVLYDRAQELFRRARQEAVDLDLRYEQAWATYYSGLAYEQQKNTDDAFRQFELALGIASSSGDVDLANEIRQHAAELHESLGENAAAIALMQDISASVPEEISAAAPQPEDEPKISENPAVVTRSDREMASYLYDQGRLLEKTFRHTEAAEILLQALELERKLLPSRPGPILLLLGKALYGAGEFEDAVKFLQEGVEKTPAASYGPQLEEGYGILATIQRGRGDYLSMKAARDHQETLLGDQPGRAAFTFEKALDMAARDGSDSSDARQLLRQAEERARAEGNGPLQQLALLQLCAWASPGAGNGSGCAGGHQALAALRSSGQPAAAQNGTLLWSQVLQQTGQPGPATAELDRLIDEMRFYRTYLPGVLGAWYWQNREAVFMAYMNQVLQTDQGKSTAIRSLAALDRLLRFDHAGGVGTAEHEADFNKLRSLFAARQSTRSPSEADNLDSQISSLVRQLNSRAPAGTDAADDLQQRVQSLAGNEAFLTYYIAPDRAYAWLGRSNQLSLIRLPWAAGQSSELSRTLEGLRWDLANSSSAGFTGIMDQLGVMLLAPMADMLPEKIYFLPTGRLQGLPLDALRLEGEYLAEQHRVVNLLSLDALGKPDSRIDSQALKSFFLAGNRQIDAGDFTVVTPPTKEIRAVADLFVGPGLRIVQGSALQWDEFDTEYFTGSSVLHLAMPGLIDLRNPTQSRLLLSDNFDQSGQEFLTPADIGRHALAARLVVLSASDLTGSSPSAFSSHTRLISEFLASGPDSVIASLWSVGDEQAARFMQRFYTSLIGNPDLLEALYAAKRGFLNENAPLDKRTWAAYELFID